ncbi:hypothetical protein NFI96_030144 [Prochilodus magdalenae]|nr:hypothetical protein NFI96_030144 [Prochilodus magdalenae]
MNREVCLLLKARDSAYRSGDQEAYSLARANLRRGISKAKHCYKHRIEEHFNSSDPRRMWQGIRTITEYKPSSTAPHTNGASLSDELNHFYARFDRGNKVILSKMDLPPGEQPLTLSTTDVCHTLRKVSARKAAGPDEVPGRVLKACAEQLAGVFTDIFNLSLAQAVVPTIFKTATIVPVPKYSTASTLNDFRPVALTPIISKCFERLVSCLPAALDFAYRRNRSTEDAISAALHTVLSHLDCQNSYVRMLFIDFSSAFNTVIPSKLIYKLSQLGISTSLCNWILDFLTDRPQSVKLDKLFSSTITLNTGVPQGCVLSPLLYSLFTYDCVPVYGSMIKFANDTTVIGLIRGDDETAYRDEVQHLAAWCDDNNLVLNTQKTKEVIVDFRKSRNQAHTPIHISRVEVECVSNFKFLGVHISEDLTWSLNSSTMVKKAQQRLYFLRSLKKAHLCPKILVDFYRCTIESILTNCISVWYGSCSASDRKALQRVVKTAQRITGTQLPTTESVYQKRCLSRARSIIKDPSHPNHELLTLLPSGRRVTGPFLTPNHELLTLLPSGRRYRSLLTLTTSFYPPSSGRRYRTLLTLTTSFLPSLPSRQALQDPSHPNHELLTLPSIRQALQDPSHPNHNELLTLLPSGSALQDPSHPNHELLTLLPSGRRYRTLLTLTTNFLPSFHPAGVTGPFSPQPRTSYPPSIRQALQEPSHPNHELLTLLPSGRRYRSLLTPTTSFLPSFHPAGVTGAFSPQPQTSYPPSIRQALQEPSHPNHELLTLLPSGRRYRSLLTLTTSFLPSFHPAGVTGAFSPQPRASYPPSIRQALQDPSHPNHELLTLLPSGRRYRTLLTLTTNFLPSFHPAGVTGPFSP